MNNTTIIGHRVQVSRGVFVNQYGEAVYSEPEPCSLSEAYRRVSQYLSRTGSEQVPFVNAVHRPLTPREICTRDTEALLAARLEGVAGEHIRGFVARELASASEGDLAVISGLVKAISRFA